MILPKNYKFVPFLFMNFDEKVTEVIFRRQAFIFDLEAKGSGVKQKIKFFCDALKPIYYDF